MYVTHRIDITSKYRQSCTFLPEHWYACKLQLTASTSYCNLNLLILFNSLPSRNFDSDGFNFVTIRFILKTFQWTACAYPSLSLYEKLYSSLLLLQLLATYHLTVSHKHLNFDLIFIRLLYAHMFKKFKIRKSRSTNNYNKK